MARLPDLDPVTQIALIGAVGVAALAVFIRAVVAGRRQYAGMPHRYPPAWTDAHIRLFADFRVAVGIALAATWLTLAATAPVMPQSFPFGRTEMLLTFALLLLTYAWVVLLTPRDWSRTVIGRVRFAPAIAVLLVWWVVLLGAALVTIAGAATGNAPSFSFSHGAFV